MDNGPLRIPALGSASLMRLRVGCGGCCQEGERKKRILSQILRFRQQKEGEEIENASFGLGAGFGCIKASSSSSKQREDDHILEGGKG